MGFVLTLAAVLQRLLLTTAAFSAPVHSLQLQGADAVFSAALLVWESVIAVLAASSSSVPPGAG